MTQNKEILSLAKEIIDNAELRRGSVEALVFKASRLANLVNEKV